MYRSGSRNCVVPVGGADIWEVTAATQLQVHSGQAYASVGTAGTIAATVVKRVDGGRIGE